MVRDADFASIATSLPLQSGPPRHSNPCDIGPLDHAVMTHISDADFAEIDVAPEFVCLSFNAWGARGLQVDERVAALELENNQ